jgi:hypothetical protein
MLVRHREQSVAHRLFALVAPLASVLVICGCEGHGILSKRAQAAGLVPLGDTTRFAPAAKAALRAADSSLRAIGEDPQQYFYKWHADSTDHMLHVELFHESGFLKRNAGEIVGNRSGKDCRLIFDPTAARVLRIELWQ